MKELPFFISQRKTSIYLLDSFWQQWYAIPPTCNMEEAKNCKDIDEVKSYGWVIFPSTTQIKLMSSISK